MCLAIPAKVKKIDGNSAWVDFGHLTKTVSLGIITNVHTGDYVLVHAGFAIGKVKAAEAHDAQRAWQELKEAISSLEKPYGA